MSTILLLLHIAANSASAQSGAGVQELSGTEAGLRVLSEVDRRFYYASDHGLRALSFTFRPQLNDPKEQKAVGRAPFRVRYTWRHDVGDRIDFIDEKGEVRTDLEKPTEEADTDKAVKRKREVRLQLLRNCRSFRQMFLGRRLRARFSKHHLKVMRRKVGDFTETRLIIEPRQPIRLRRLKISLDRDGLPWKWERQLVSGHVQQDQNDFAKRPEGYLLASYKRYMSPPTATEKGFMYALEIKYQTVGGFILPATMRKTGKDLPYTEKGITEFRGVLVNDAVPAFKPMKLTAPAPPPTPKPTSRPGK